MTTLDIENGGEVTADRPEVLSSDLARHSSLYTAFVTTQVVVLFFGRGLSHKEAVEYLNLAIFWGLINAVVWVKVFQRNDRTLSDKWGNFVTVVASIVVIGWICIFTLVSAGV